MSPTFVNVICFGALVEQQPRTTRHHDYELLVYDINMQLKTTEKINEEKWGGNARRTTLHSIQCVCVCVCSSH